MKILFAGTPELAVPTLTALADSTQHEVVGILTRPDAPLGRNRILTASPVATEAQSLGLPIIKASSVTPEVDQQLQATGADIAVVVAYGALLHQRTLDLFTHGWINLHFSMLPRWRGATPVQHAILHGETPASTVFSLVKDLDAGPIWAQASYPQFAELAAGAQLEQLAAYGIDQVFEALTAIAAGAQPVTQPQESPTPYAAKLARRDGYLSPAQTADQLLRKWRAFTPEPGAFFVLDGAQIKAVELAPATATLAAEEPTTGEVVLSRKQAILATDAGLIELRRIQPPGKKPMLATDWLRGRHGITRFE